MRVYDTSLNGTAAAGAGSTQASQNTGRPAENRGTGAGSADRVELSSTLARLTRAISTDGAQRTANVEALTAQYESGKYRADSVSTAKAMVSELLATGVG